jgi:DNA-binding transcriptional ArsR family regulator
MGEYKAAAADRQLDAAFGALSHSSRRAMLERLSDGRATVTQIAEQFPDALNTVSRHLKVLEHAGLIERSVEGREHHLSLNLAHLLEAMQWAARQAEFWHRRLDALEAQFAAAKTPARTRHKSKRGTHAPSD